MERRKELVMGNWTTEKTTTYFNVRLVGDAKHFPKNGDKPAATFFPIIDGSKGGEDIFVDVKAVKGAERLAGLKKGQEVTVRGTVEFGLDKNGKLRGKIWDGVVSLPAATREALKAQAEAAAPPPAEDPAEEASDSEAEAPAFE